MRDVPREHDAATQKFRAKKKFNPEGNNKQNLTTLAESILNKSTAQEEKVQLIERSLLILDEYGMENVILKNSGNRLIQACLKYGNGTSKELIFLKMMKADMEKILTDASGKSVVKKIMIHIKNKKLLDIFQNFVETNFAKLLQDPHGKASLSSYIESIPESLSLDLLRQHLAAVPTEDEARARVQEVLEQKTVSNSIDQFWMYLHWNVIPEDSKRILVEELKESLDLLLRTKVNGILLYCKIFDFVDLKDKTKMLKKCISKKLEEVIKKNPNSLFLLVKIINSYDDSGNIANILYNEILSNYYSFVENQVSVTFLFYILCEDFEKEFSVKFPPKLVKAIKDDLMVNTGKKPIARKLEEARIKLFNNDSFKELMKPAFILKAYDSTFICVLLSMILNYFIKSETCKESITSFIEVIIDNTKDNLELDDTTEINKSLLLSHPFTHRMIKKFIQSFGAATSDFKTELEGMIEELVQLMIENIEVLIKTRTVFIYIALLENTSYAGYIAKKVKDLDHYAELKASPDQGMKILIKLVEAN